MPEVRPFRALLYNPSVVGDLSRVIAPPYDLITPEQQDDLYSRSPYNVIRLEFGKAFPTDTEADNRYTRAARFYRQWLQQGALVLDNSPAFYLMREDYRDKGSPRTRWGLMAAVRLSPWERGEILPHEHTREALKQDRLRLMLACRANFSPLMALYQDPDGAVARAMEGMAHRAPDMEVPSDGDRRYQVWVIREPGALRLLHRLLSGRTLYMADGHHRYETALMYQERAAPEDHHPDAAHNFVLMCLIRMQDPGLQLLSFHRLVCGLPPEALASLQTRIFRLFQVERRVEGRLDLPGLESFLAQVRAWDRSRPAFGLVDARGGRFVLMSLRHLGPLEGQAQVEELYHCDTWVLHKAVLDPVLGEGNGGEGQVHYVYDLEMALHRLLEGGCPVAFLLRPISQELFLRLVHRGQRLPAKTTYFHPKLPTGLAMLPLEGRIPPVA